MTIEMEMDPDTVASIISTGLLILLILSFVLVLRDKRQARNEREADGPASDPAPPDAHIEVEQDTKVPLS